MPIAETAAALMASDEFIVAVKGIITYVAPKAWKKLKSYLGKPHGSKVKMGAFDGCAIEMFGTRPCIIADPDEGAIVFLTSDTVRSYQFAKEKFRFKRMKDYYYYEVTFKDGSESYIRLSEKKRDAFLRQMSSQDW